MALKTDYNMLKSPKNRCRICLEATNGKIELNQTIHYKKTGIVLRELLEFCLNEQVHKNGKADGVCLDCMEKGMVYYEFKRRFKISQGVLLRGMEGNNGFEIKVEEDFEEGSFAVESENKVIKHEILEEEEMEQVKENENECELPTTTTETEKSTPTTRLSNKLTPTLSSGKPTTPPDQTSDSLGEKAGVEHKCKLCQKTFKLRSRLVRYKCKHTQTVKQRNRCNCVQESSAALVQNMRNVYQQKTLKNTDLLLPVTETDIPTPPAPTTKIDKHTCEYCGKSFSRAGTLASHRRIHTGEKPYSCKECGRSFAHPWAFKVHQVLHTKQKDHVCQKCGATFARALYLRRHVVIHSTERPSYKCTICKKAFRSIWGRKGHMLTHTGLRNYACEFCGKRFNRKSCFNVHRKIHTGEKPHICKVCGKGFIRADYLRKHMKTHLTK